MGKLVRLLMLCGVIVCVASFAWADVITVDGDDSDWLNPDSTHDDPDEAEVTLQGYDIDYTYAVWDTVNAMSAYLTQTIDPCTQAYGADFVEYVMDADENKSTGSPNWYGLEGADYRITWDLDGTEYTAYNPTSASHVPKFYEWNSGTTDWDLVTGMSATDLVIAWGDDGTDYSVIECTLNPSYIGMPADYVWGCYLDNGDISADDRSPGTMRQRGYTPEPTTLALLPIGLAGLAYWRRRKRED